MIDLGQRVLDAARLEAQRADDAEGAGVRTAIVRQHRGKALVARERKAVVAALEQLVPRSGYAEGAMLLAHTALFDRFAVAHRGIHHTRHIAREPVQHIVAGKVMQRTLEPRQFCQALGAVLMQHIANRGDAAPACCLGREEGRVFGPRHRPDQRHDGLRSKGINARFGLGWTELLSDAVEGLHLVLGCDCAGQHHQVDGVEQVVRLGGLRTKVVADVGARPRGIEQEYLHSALTR